MKDRVILNIIKNKTYLLVYHKEELVGKIEIANNNKSSSVSLRIHGNKEQTYVKVEKEKKVNELNLEE